MLGFVSLAHPAPCELGGSASVKHVLGAMRPGKAVGLDGWSLEELRLLPDFFLRWLADLFNAVEDGRPWPRHLLSPEGVLLPNGDSGNPLDRPLIWLLSMPYRVWVAGRAKTLFRWVAGWSGRGPGEGAEDQSWRLALEFEAAYADGLGVGGAALDWSKAYDSIDLWLLETACCRSPLSERVWRPALQVYAARRRLRVRGAVGDFWEPTAGLLPGCALAVSFLALITRPWFLAMTALDPALSPRLYVDDATFWVQGRLGQVLPVVRRGMECTMAYEQAFGWQLNCIKSKPFASHASLRSACEGLGGLAVDIEFLDLGVSARVDGRRRPILKLGGSSGPCGGLPWFPACPSRSR